MSVCIVQVSFIFGCRQLVGIAEVQFPRDGSGPVANDVRARLVGFGWDDTGADCYCVWCNERKSTADRNDSVKETQVEEGGHERIENIIE